MCLFAFFLLAQIWNVSAIDTPRFEQLSYRDGLVNSAVSSIIRDPDGYLWFGSQSGLHRYDGYSMEVITSVPFSDEGLNHHLVQTLYMSNQNSIWIGTYDGINVLDLNDYSMRSYHTSAEVVTAIAQDSSQRYWAGTLNGLELINTESGEMRRFLHNPENERSLPENTIRTLHLDSRGNLWIGSYGGLSLLIEDADDPADYEFRNFKVEDGLTSPFIMSITEDSDGDLIIGTWGGGVLRFDLNSEEFSVIIDTAEPIYALAYHKEYGLFAGSWGGGLYHLNPHDGSVSNARHNPQQERSLAHDIVYSLHIDDYGVIWIGTNGNGISKLNYNQKDFILIDSQGGSQKGIAAARVRSLLELENGSILIGFQNAGIDRYDRDTGIVYSYRNGNEPNGLGDNTINDLLRLNNGLVLVASNNGIYEYNPESRIFRHVDYNPDPNGSVNENIIYSLTEQQDGTLWIGTYNRGVIKWDPDGRHVRFEHDPENPGSLSNNLVYQVYIDSNNNVWVATNVGLNLYHPESSTFSHFFHDQSDTSTITSNSVSSIYEDSRGMLWIGTRAGGLNLFSPESDRFIRHFTTNTGLESNSIMSINEGPDNFMYVATSNGLHTINPFNFEIKIISEADGLPIREFSGSSIKLVDDSLVFGSFGALIHISESIVPTTAIEPETIITDIKIHNDSLQDTNSNRVRELDLRHTDNRIGFAFASTDFTLPARNRYEVRMSGIDEDWQLLGNRQFVEYVNLSPGYYSFKVRSTNSHGISDTSGREIFIRIQPPFWQTTIFRAALLFMLLGCVVLLNYLNTNRLRIQNMRLDNQIRKRTSELTKVNEELTASQEEKDRFFHILAHDLRGPIAGLKSFSEGLYEVRNNLSPEDIEEALSTIFDTSTGISSLLERLLEWGNLQRNRDPLVFQQILLKDLTDECCSGFASMLEAKGIQLTVDIDPELNFFTDSKILSSVIHNLVHNAIKFSESGDVIHLKAALNSNSELEFSVRDTGIGIPEDKLSDVLLLDKFESTRGTAGEKGTGLGLPLVKQQLGILGAGMKIRSEEGEGTEITFRLPLQEE
ncbi:ligand-binding sensor domain-containing diguanylate cyclase [Spirochaeta dissipatitropha]